NGDGRADLVLGGFPGASAKLTVLLQNADGTLAQGDQFDLDSLTAVVALADVNGDGRPDAILSRSSASLLGYVLLNDGQGHFLHQPNYQVGPPKYTLGFDLFDVTNEPLVLGDLNGDGKLDILTAVHNGFAVAGSLDRQITVQLGNGDGTFRPGTNVP